MLVWCCSTAKGETLLRLSSLILVVLLAKLEQNSNDVQLLLEEARVSSCHVVSQLFRNASSPERIQGRDSVAGKVICKRILPWTKVTRCLEFPERDGAQEGAEPAQLLLTQNNDFTQKKQNLAKAPGLKFSLKTRVRSFPF